jgi:hypothetical protein
VEELVITLEVVGTGLEGVELTAAVIAVGITGGCITFDLLADLFDSALDKRLSPLAALFASIAMLSSALDLWNVFQSHSPPLELSHLALQPTPTPSIAALGSSCSLKSNQFA